MEREILPPPEGHAFLKCPQANQTGIQALAATTLIEALSSRISEKSPAGTKGLTL